MAKTIISDSKSGVTIVHDSDGKNQPLPQGAGQAVVASTIGSTKKVSGTAVGAVVNNPA